MEEDNQVSMKKMLYGSALGDVQVGPAMAKNTTIKATTREKSERIAPKSQRGEV